MNLGDGVALITGGAGGIGKELARALLKTGCRVAIADIDDARLADAKEELERVARNHAPGGWDAEVCGQVGVAASSALSVHRADVGRLEACEALVKEVLAAHEGRITLLINNAGIVAADSLGSLSWSAIRQVVDVNLWSAIYLTKLLLPTLAAQPAGACVVNVSSLEGVVAIPGNLPYCVSKYAMRGFSEALACDAAILYPSVNVMCVMPGFVSTDMLEHCKDRINANALLTNDAWKSRVPDVATMSSYFKALGSTTPPAAAAQILRGVRRGQRAVMVGNDSLILIGLRRLFGTYFYWPVVYWPAFSLTLIGVRLIGRRTLLAACVLLLWLRYRRGRRFSSTGR